jgi:hypothetical protein
MLPGGVGPALWASAFAAHCTLTDFRSTMQEIERLGVYTSGGDAPGMNA